MLLASIFFARKSRHVKPAWKIIAIVNRDAAVRRVSLDVRLHPVRYKLFDASAS